MVSTELPTAMMALGLPRRRARRRYRAPRKVSVRVALNTIRPTVPASHGLPLPRALLRDLPADWWVCGQNLAHDTRCAAVGNRAISTPISAINSAAATVSTPAAFRWRSAKRCLRSHDSCTHLQGVPPEYTM